MSKSDLGLLTLNAFLLCFSFVGFAGNDEDALMAGAVLAMIAAIANGAMVVWRQNRQREPESRRTATDEIDVHAVLDLDARLEALENAQHDAVDAARWRALVESGQVTGPGAEPLATAPDARRNGTGDRA